MADRMNCTADESKECCGVQLGDGLTVFCERHQIEKTAHLIELCRQPDGKYLRLWDRVKNGALVPVTGTAAKATGCCGGAIPAALRAGWDLGKAVVAFTASGFKLVDTDEYERRLKICDECEHRDGHRCGICLCFVVVKAKATAWHCPLERW